MDVFEETLDLVEFTDGQMREIDTLYLKALEKDKLNSILLIKIKNMLENLRSSLDYCALGLCRKYGENVPNKMQFPYAPLNKPKSYFVKSVDRNIPGLRKNREDIYRILEQMQHFSHKKASVVS